MANPDLKTTVRDSGLGFAAAVADQTPPSFVPAPKRVEGTAIAALVLGLVSPIAALFFGVPGVVIGLAALILGLRARDRIKKSGGVLGGGGIALAGSLVGIGGILVGLGWALLLYGLLRAMTSTVNSTGTEPPILP